MFTLHPFLSYCYLTVYYTGLLSLLFAMTAPGTRIANTSASCGRQHRQFLPLLHAQALFLPATPDTSANPATDAVASWGAPIAVNPAHGTVWTVNPDAGTVSVIDPQQQQEVAEIAVGVEPWSLTVDSTGNFVYVADRATGTLSKIAAANAELVAARYIGPELGNIALTPSGARAYVTSLTAHDVRVIDTATLQVTSRIPVSTTPLCHCHHQ